MSFHSGSKQGPIDVQPGQLPTSPQPGGNPTGGIPPGIGAPGGGAFPNFEVGVPGALPPNIGPSSSGGGAFPNPGGTLPGLGIPGTGAAIPGLLGPGGIPGGVVPGVGAPGGTFPGLPQSLSPDGLALGYGGPISDGSSNPAAFDARRVKLNGIPEKLQNLTALQLLDLVVKQLDHPDGIQYFIDEHAVILAARGAEYRFLDGTVSQATTRLRWEPLEDDWKDE